MLKTCPLDSKTTRMDHRKFIHSWILLYHVPSFIWDKELQHPTGKWICNSNFEFPVSDAARRWQPRCSQQFTCHSMEVLLLPTTRNQLCVWYESCWLNSKNCAIFPTSGMHICWRWCSKALLWNATVFFLIQKNMYCICMAATWRSPSSAVNSPP